MRTRLTCVALVVLGFLANELFTHVSFDSKERFVRGATYAFLGYMLAVPITLFFLKGERRWRLAVFGLWLAYVFFFGYVMLTMT
jgi:hypothetical protein